MNKRDIITIEDLSDAEIRQIFRLADKYLTDYGDYRRLDNNNRPCRIRGRAMIANELVLASIFFEPSTRTRFSFETAMTRLGGHCITASDVAATSASKGESLADTVRVVEGYADLIVLRHPFEGAARVASEFSSVPVINAGDGSHEHPTQTLCDLYTLCREDKDYKSGEIDLTGRTVLLCGDLKHGRTVHSLVYALARFNAQIALLPAEGLGLPEHVLSRLSERWDCRPIKIDNNANRSLFEGESLGADAVYIIADKPQTSSRRYVKLKDVLAEVDICYVTRMQRERIDPNGAQLASYPVINSSFLKQYLKKEARILHPLPRVNELDSSLDTDSRAVYFKQASYGVPIRMALIATLFGKNEDYKLEQIDYPDRKLYLGNDSIICLNPNCISTKPNEIRHVRSKFWEIEGEKPRLRCVYCEYEIPLDGVDLGERSRFRSAVNSEPPITPHATLGADDSTTNAEVLHSLNGHSTRRNGIPVSNK